MVKQRVVTTSWDDGDPSDLRVANLLRSRGLLGTFYVPVNPYVGRNRLSDSDLRSLCSDGFEIGAHTVSHKDLSKLNGNELTKEVGDCKQILQQSLGKEVPMFCYPNGRYSAAVIRRVQEAGYKGARSTRMLSMSVDFPALEMPTTVQAFPHRTSAYVRNLGRAKNIPGLVQYLMKLRRFERWVDLGKHLFDEVLKNGGIWHLYGHSWELEELGIWNYLSEMFDYVSGREGVTYATNGQVSALLNRCRPESQLPTDERGRPVCSALRM